MRDHTTRTAALLLPKRHPEHHTHTPWLSRRISHVHMQRVASRTSTNSVMSKAARMINAPAAASMYTALS